MLAGSTPVLVHNAGCDEWAEAFQAANGGEIRTFNGGMRPDGRPAALGGYRPGGPGTPLLDEDWYHHTVVVRDGKVYDQWHEDGIGIEEYKMLFDDREFIDFGF